MDTSKQMNITVEAYSPVGRSGHSGDIRHLCRNVLHLLPAFERILHTPRSLGLPEVTTRLSSQWRPRITLALTKQLSCTASETLMCVKLYLLLQLLSFNFRYFRSFESIQESQGLSVLGPEEL